MECFLSGKTKECCPANKLTEDLRVVLWRFSHSCNDVILVLASTSYSRHYISSSTPGTPLAMTCSNLPSIY